MKNKLSMEFVPATSPIEQAVTKFGGQPVWIGNPAWPTSRATGGQMRFICQILLPDDIFGTSLPTMAYVFMTEDDADVGTTWDPDGGENAVIIQPGSTQLPVSAFATGPTLFNVVEIDGNSSEYVSCEFGVNLVGGVDHQSEPNDFRLIVEDPLISKEDYGKHLKSFRANKIGGVPFFIESDEYPDDEPWDLLLQLYSGNVPFHLNMGDRGIAYVFVSKDRSVGKMLWQCY